MNGLTRTSRLSCLAFAAAIAATSTSFSAPALAAEPPLPAPSWTGFYFGLHGGWGWGTTDIWDPIFHAVYSPTQVKYNGPLAGAQAGFNWQMGNFVVGAEVDGSWAFVRGNSSTNGVFTSSARDAFGYTSLATATGRVGYTMGQWLAYAKGGVARAEMEVTTGNISALPVTYESSLIGAVGGAGFEVAFLRNVSAKAEYNYIWLPVDKLVYANVNSISSLEHHIHVVKFGVNVRLGPDTFR
jgi:opacity protein-like surface antigen